MSSPSQRRNQATPSGYLDREHTDAEWLAAQEGVDALMRVAEAADALVPYLDANEVVPDRERGALLNALYVIGLGERR